MSMHISVRKKHIQTQYESLKTEISRLKNNMEFTERQFTEKIYDVEQYVLDKVKKTAEETRKKAKQVLKETADRTEKLKIRVQESSECFSTQQKSKHKLTDYEIKIRELRCELNRLKKIEFPMLICSHVDEFINNCEQLINVDPDDKETAAESSHWACTDSISIEQSRRQSVASSSYLSVSGNAHYIDREVSQFTNVSDVDVIVVNNPNKKEVASGKNHPKEDEMNTLSENDSVNESLVTGIQKLSSVCISGEEHGAIKAITVSDKDKIVALDTEQRAYFISSDKSDKSNKFIKQSKFHPKDYPHDVEFLESQENIITPVTCGNTNYMLRVLSFGSNKNSFQKIESTKLICTMKQHCVSVRTKRNGCLVACIACPQELRLISYTKNGRISRKYPQRAVVINDRFMDDSLNQERYTVKLDEDATEAYVIKSDKQSLNCFLLESESFGETKWMYESENMILSDLCVYRKHVLVADNANGKILEFETASGNLIQKIDLYPFAILNPFAITMKHNQIFLSEYTDRWGRDKELKRRKTITILSFRDTETP